jgi:hypothetical protein
MRSWLPFLFVAGLAACNRLPGGSGNAADAAADDPIANLQIVDRNADPAHIQRLLASAMPGALGGARDPHYRNVRAGAGGAVCGDVSVAGGPPRPFVVTAEGAAVVAEGPKLNFADPSDLAADAWVRWCATPEEIPAIQAEIRRAAADPANIAMAAPAHAGVSAEPADVPPPEAVREAPAPPSGARPTPPPPPPPAGDIDSFTNAVRR